MGGAEYNFKGCYGGFVDCHICFIEVTYHIWNWERNGFPHWEPPPPAFLKINVGVACINS